MDPCPTPEFTCSDTKKCSTGGTCTPDLTKGGTASGGGATTGTDTVPPVISVRGVGNALRSKDGVILGLEVGCCARARVARCLLAWERPGSLVCLHDERVVKLCTGGPCTHAVA